MHTMNVKTKYYNLLKSGKKIIELRLFDEKRQKIKIGDEILFSDSSNQDDNFKASSKLSDEVSADLKKRGMKFVGSTIIYSYLQAIGVINDHELNCALY